MKFVTSLASPSVRCAILTKFDQIMRSGVYAEGDCTVEAESELTRVLGVPSLTMNSCGSALLTAFRYWHRKGKRVVFMQNNTFWATAGMAQEAEMSVRLVDSRPDCPSMSVESLIAAMEAYKVKNSVSSAVVCLTHVGGWVAKDYAFIAMYCQQEKIPLIEDCAHLFGNPGYEPMPEATQCWSFYPTKAVPIGDGGAISTHDMGLFDFADKFRKYGKWRDREGVMKYGSGQNLRISEFNAAVLVHQISRLDEIVYKRQQCAAALQSIAPCLLEGPSNFYKYPVKKQDARGLKVTSPVYSRTDQIDHTMPNARADVPLTNSHAWAMSHECLPVGEGLYDQMSTDSIRKTLEIRQ